MSADAAPSRTREHFDHPARLTLIALACLVLATDPTAVPGRYTWWSLVYIVPALAVLWWGRSRDYRALLLFGSAFYGLTLLRIVLFISYEGFARRAGVALNVLLMVFAQGFVSRRRPYAERRGGAC